MKNPDLTEQVKQFYFLFLKIKSSFRFLKEKETKLKQLLSG